MCIPSILKIFFFFGAFGGDLKDGELELAIGAGVGGTSGGAFETYAAGIGEPFMFAPCVAFA